MRREEVERIFRRFGPMVLRRARSLLGNDEASKDIMQDVFISAMVEPRIFDDPEEAAAWLYRVTTNACLNQLRNTRRRRELERENFTCEERSNPAPEKRMIAHQLLADADRAWSEAAVLVHVDGMSYEEASAFLGVSKRTVSNLLTRFRTFCLERLGEGE